MRISPCLIPGCRNTNIIGRGWCSAHYNRWHRHGDPLAGRVKEGTINDFFDMASHYYGNDCLIWPSKRKYTTLCRDGKRIIASRAMCELVNGPSPSPNHHAAHSCGNGHLSCITPRHLRWATPSENASDRIAHGTTNRGERHGMAKLTTADVLEICSRLKKGNVQAKIAKDFGVSQGSIARIKRGECWSWLTGAGE